MKYGFAIVAALCLLSAPAFAEDMHHEHAGDQMCFPSVSTGSVDEDFMRNMIPHHQMAVDMAKKELAEGTDPVARKLAEDIIAAQEKEIALMQGWVENRAQDGKK